MNKSDSSATDTSKHENRCTVCKHPERKAIEREFRLCRPRMEIERRYDLPRDSLYRHAKYFDLASQRSTEDVWWTIVEHGLQAMAGKPPTAAHVNEALKHIARMRGELNDSKDIMALMFPGKTDRQVAHYGKTSQWLPDEELDRVESRTQ